ncbi:thioredoxin family protein [Halobacteriales archaeon SW_7_68_16]|nr:MAG: thioredoxin family protein [Halobacteriales archaeon SW_7_68_16]
MVALDSESDAVARGEPAPDFELPDTDGTTRSLDSFDGSALLVVFTCNHCPYAKAKFGVMNDMAADYDDLAVVGINPNDAEECPEDSHEKMREYVDRGEIAFDAYLRDESQAVARAYGAVCTPDPFLFARRDGGYRLVYHGRFDDALSPDADPSGEPGFEMRAIVDDILAGEAPEPEFAPSRGCSIKWRD